MSFIYALKITKEGQVGALEQCQHKPMLTMTNYPLLKSDPMVSSNKLWEEVKLGNSMNDSAVTDHVIHTQVALIHGCEMS